MKKLLLLSICSLSVFCSAMDPRDPNAKKKRTLSCPVNPGLLHKVLNQRSPSNSASNSPRFTSPRSPNGGSPRTPRTTAAYLAKVYNPNGPQGALVEKWLTSKVETKGQEQENAFNCPEDNNLQMLLEFTQLNVRLERKRKELASIPPHNTQRVATLTHEIEILSKKRSALIALLDPEKRFRD